MASMLSDYKDVETLKNYIMENGVGSSRITGTVHVLEHRLFWPQLKLRVIWRFYLIAIRTN